MKRMTSELAGMKKTATVVMLITVMTALLFAGCAAGGPATDEGPENGAAADDKFVLSEWLEDEANAMSLQFIEAYVYAGPSDYEPVSAVELDESDMQYVLDALNDVEFFPDAANEPMKLVFAFGMNEPFVFFYSRDDGLLVENEGYFYMAPYAGNPRLEELTAFIDETALAYNIEIPCDPPMPSGEQVYITASYGPGTAQFDMLVEYLDSAGILFSGMTVYEVQVWDEHLEEWIPNSEIDGTYTITLPVSGDLILHNSAMTGGVEELPGGSSVTVETGFGIFGVVTTTK